MTAPTYVLRPPSYIKNVPFWPPMVVGVPQGLAVLRIDGVWINTEVATQDQIDAADYYFPGGSDHEVDEATAVLLTNAGYIVTPMIAVAGLALVGTATAG